MRMVAMDTVAITDYVIGSPQSMQGYMTSYMAGSAYFKGFPPAYLHFTTNKKTAIAGEVGGGGQHFSTKLSSLFLKGKIVNLYWNGKEDA